MKIISPFHDYYDGVQSLGQDKSLVYLRQRQEVVAPQRRDYPEPPDAHLGGWLRSGLKFEEWYGKSCRVFARPLWVAVAGKVYRGYRLLRRSLSGGATYEVEADRVAFAWDLPALTVLAVEMGVPDPLLSRAKKSSSFPGLEWLSRQGTEELPGRLAEAGIVISAAYLDHEGAKDRDPLILNPQLAAFQFGKVMDAFQVYQEIAMWVGGVLPQRGAMTATVSDADRYVEHGFDPKTSFRKAASGKS
ncbi:MAG TPA: hypothetical protein VN375_19110 [Vicinamibacteria bacterium]|jgi:hypothetical protein|nr:hypothetical protein [Vicinamibacteria bacterium]